MSLFCVPIAGSLHEYRIRGRYPKNKLNPFFLRPAAKKDGRVDGCGESTSVGCTFLQFTPWTGDGRGEGRINIMALSGRSLKS